MTQTTRVAICAVLGVFALSLALAINTSCFEMGPDGAGWQAYLDYQWADRAPFSQTGVDAHQGDFDAYYPLIADYTIPGLLYRLAGQTHAPPPRFMYATYTAALFIVVVALGTWFGLARIPALLAAFIAAFFFPPLVVHREALTFHFLHLNPHWMQLIVFSALAILSVWALDGKWTLTRWLLICVPAVCVSLEILGVGAMAIFTPWILVYSAGALAFSKSRSALVQKLLAGVVVLLVLAISGQAAYLYGLERYSAYHYFSNEFDWDIPLLPRMSIFFHAPFGRLLIVLGVIGAILTIVRGRDRLRQLGITHLVATVTFGIFAAVFFLWTYHRGYRSSSPLYFETTLLPFAALFSGFALTEIASFVLRFVRVSRQQAAEIALWGLVLAVGSYNVLAATGRIHRDECTWQQLYANVRPNEVTKVLHDKIALVPGSVFRGNEVTIDWVDDQRWVPSGEMNDNNRLRLAQTGNDTRLFGLWHYDIPTMYQYFTFITAPYYLFMTEFLSRPQDWQTRSGLVLTHVDPRILRLLGVRYLVTDHASDAGNQVVVQPLKDGKTLRLIELDSPNVGDYSPTAVERVKDFHTGLARMHESTFDGRSTVITDVTDPPLGATIAPAKDAILTYETYGFHLEARSTGTSILVVPAQFSRCWSVRGSGTPRLFRANLLQLGIVFSGNLNARLVFDYGPLFAATCRLRDVADVDRLDIARGRVIPRTY